MVLVGGQELLGFGFMGIGLLGLLGFNDLGYVVAHFAKPYVRYIPRYVDIKAQIGSLIFVITYVQIIVGLVVCAR